MLRFFLVNILIFSHLSWAKIPRVIHLTNGEWPPYLSKSLPNGGPSSQVIVEAFRLQGIEVIWGWYPWARSYILAKEGEYDGTVIWSVNEERNEYFLYTVPVLEEKRVLFHLVTKPIEWRTMNDLSKYEIGATVGYQYSKDFQEAEAQGILKVRRIAKESNNFKMLIANRVDLVIATYRVGYALIASKLSENEGNMITHNNRYVDIQHWSVLISKKSQYGDYFIEQFNYGFKKLVESGRYDEIMKNR